MSVATRFLNNNPLSTMSLTRDSRGDQGKASKIMPGMPMAKLGDVISDASARNLGMWYQAFCRNALKAA